METAAPHITASCVISKNTVSRDGNMLFEQHGGLNEFLTAVYQRFSLNYPKFYKMDHLSKLGWLASEILLNPGFNKSRYQASDVGLVLTNSNASLDADFRYWDSVQDFASPSLFVYTLPNIVIGEICIRNGFKGEDAFYITDGFNPVLIHQQVSYLLANDILQACICGWVDVVGQDYKAALFLVEKSTDGISFDSNELEQLFNHIPQ